MRENLSGVLVIRAFGNEKHSEERFDKANIDLTKVNLFVNRTMGVNANYDVYYEYCDCF